MRNDDPREAGAQPPFKPQQQEPPGQTRELDPRPEIVARVFLLNLALATLAVNVVVLVPNAEPANLTQLPAATAPTAVPCALLSSTSCTPE